MIDANFALVLAAFGVIALGAGTGLVVATLRARTEHSPAARMREQAEAMALQEKLDEMAETLERRRKRAETAEQRRRERESNEAQQGELVDPSRMTRAQQLEHFRNIVRSRRMQ